jgi:hypothetical protein
VRYRAPARLTIQPDTPQGPDDTNWKIAGELVALNNGIQVTTGAT